MAAIYSRVRFVASCILGVVFAILPALILSSLTARKEGFVLFLIPLAIVFTAAVEKGWAFARKQDAAYIRKQCEKRYAEGKPPLGEG